MSNVLLQFSRNIVTIKPHVPLIKFRKGGLDGAHHANITTPAPASSSGSKKVKGGSSKPVIEDFQLPLKYRRRPIDDIEINAINSGGVL